MFAFSKDVWIPAVRLGGVPENPDLLLKTFLSSRFEEFSSFRLPPLLIISAFLVSSSA